MEQWLADYELEDTQDFVYVATAYLSMYEEGQLPKSLLRQFETYIRRNALNFNAQQAIHLVQVFYKCGSSYTMEVFDRIIGLNIDDIPIRQIFDAFVAFASSEKAEVRPKITQLLLKTLSENLEQLLPSQLIVLCNVLLDPENLSRSETLIKGLEIDKFLLNSIGMLDQHDLVMAVEVFANSTLQDVQVAIETQLVQNMRLLQPDLASDLLYRLTSRQMGTRTLITAAIKRVELDSHMIATLSPQTIC